LISCTAFEHWVWASDDCPSNEDECVQGWTTPHFRRSISICYERVLTVERGQPMLEEGIVADTSVVSTAGRGNRLVIDAATCMVDGATAAVVLWCQESR